MLAISLRHVLLFIANVLGVTDVTEGVQAALQSASGTSFSQTCQTSKEQKLLNIQEHKLIFVVYGLLRDKPDLGPFPVDVPQTLVLAESRLFLIGPELWAGFGMSCFSSKEETTHSLLSSRSYFDFTAAAAVPVSEDPLKNEMVHLKRLFLFINKCQKCQTPADVGAEMNGRGLINISNLSNRR